MLKDIILIGSGLLIAIIFTVVRNIVIKTGKGIIKSEFDKNKAIQGLLSIGNPVLWMKDIVGILNVRKLVIYGLILAVFGGYMYYKGQSGKPVHFNLAYEKEFTLKLNGQTLHKPKNSSQLEVRDAKGNIVKVISAKDIPELYKKLKPYGIIFEPVAVIGVGVGTTDKGFEGGIGVRYLKYFKWVMDICLTNRGFYPFGISYKLSENSAIGISAGTGFKGNDIGLFKRFLLKFTLKF